MRRSELYNFQIKPGQFKSIKESLNLTNVSKYFFDGLNPDNRQMFDR